MHFRLSLATLLLAVFTLVLSSDAIGNQAKTTPDYEAFSALPTYWTPALSPNGDKVAFVQNTTGDNAIAMLATYDLIEGKKHFLLQSDNERVKIRWYKWVNNERLVVSARYETRRGTTKVHDTRLLSIKYDGSGKGAFNLVNWERIKQRAGNPDIFLSFMTT